MRLPSIQHEIADQRGEDEPVHGKGDERHATHQGDEHLDGDERRHKRADKAQGEKNQAERAAE